MAGTAFLAHFQQHGVLVAIDTHFDHVLDVTRGFALDPKLAARPAPIRARAPISRVARRAASFIQASIRHLMRLRILRDRRDQAIGIELRTQVRRFVLCGPGEGRFK